MPRVVAMVPEVARINLHSSYRYKPPLFRVIPREQSDRGNPFPMDVPIVVSTAERENGSFGFAQDDMHFRIVLKLVSRGR